MEEKGQIDWNELKERTIKEAKFLETLKWQKSNHYDPSSVSFEWHKSLHPSTKHWVFKSSSRHIWTLEQILPHWRPEILDLDPTVYGLDVLEKGEDSYVRHVLQGSIFPPIRRDFVLFETAEFDGKDLRCYFRSVEHPSAPVKVGIQRMVVHSSMFHWRRDPESNGTIFTVYYHLDPDSSGTEKFDCTTLYGIGRYHPNVNVAYKVIFPKDDRDRIMKSQIASQKSILLKILQYPLNVQPAGNKFEMKFDWKEKEKGIMLTAIGGMPLDCAPEHLGNFLKRLDDWCISNSLTDLVELVKQNGHYSERVHYTLLPGFNTDGKQVDSLLNVCDWSNPYITVHLYKSVERPTHPKKPGIIRSTVLPSGYFFFPVNEGKAACIWISQVFYEDLGGYTKEEMFEGYKFRMIQTTNMLRNVATKSKEEIELMITSGTPFLDLSDKSELPYTYMDDLEAKTFPEVEKAIEREERKRKNPEGISKKNKTMKITKVEAPIIESDYQGDCELENLPAEIVDIIIRQLDLVSLIFLSSTNKRFRNIIQSTRLWKDLFFRSVSSQTSFVMDVSDNIKTIAIDFKTILRRNYVLQKNYDRCKFAFKQFDGHTQEVNNVDFVGTDYLLSGSKDTSLLLWNIQTGKCEKKFQVNNGGAILNSGTILGGGTIVAAMEGGTLCTWDVHSGQPIWVRRFNVVPKGFHFFSNRFFTWGYLPSFDLWSISSGLRQKCYVGHITKVTAVKTFEEVVASSSEDNTVKVWNEEASSCATTFTHENQVRDLALFRNNLLIAEDTVAKLYDLRTNSVVNQWEFDSPIEKISLDENRIFLGMDRFVKYWDIRNSQVIHELRGSSRITSLKIDSHRIAAGAENGSLYLWDFYDQ